MTQSPKCLKYGFEKMESVYHGPGNVKYDDDLVKYFYQIVNTLAKEQLLEGLSVLMPKILLSDKVTRAMTGETVENFASSAQATSAQNRVLESAAELAALQKQEKAMANGQKPNINTTQGQVWKTMVSQDPNAGVDFIDDIDHGLGKVDFNELYEKTQKWVKATMQE